MTELLQNSCKSARKKYRSSLKDEASISNQKEELESKRKKTESEESARIERRREALKSRSSFCSSKFLLPVYTTKGSQKEDTAKSNKRKNDDVALDGKSKPKVSKETSKDARSKPKSSKATNDADINQNLTLWTSFWIQKLTKNVSFW